MKRFRAVIAQSALETSLFARDKITLFWSLVFPIVLIFILGYTFGSRGPQAKTYVSALMSGIIGTNVMAMALFNIGASLSQYRETGLLRRLVVAKVPLVDVLLGILTHRYAIVIMQLGVMMVMAHFIFDYVMPPERLSYAVCVVVGVVGFTGLGLAFALLVRTSNEAIAMSNIIYLPLSFLSGAYFSVDGLPGSTYLHWLPSAALIDALRVSAQVPLAGLFGETSFRLLLGWSIVLIAVAFSLRKRLALDPRHL